MSENENGLQGYKPEDQPVEPAPLPEENEVAAEFDGTDPLPVEDQTAVDFEVHDEEDVAAILSRDATDGPGFEKESELPKEDFDGFAEENVEESQ